MHWEDRGQGFLRENLSGESEYLSFVPAPLDKVVSVQLDEESIRLLGSCSRKIGELEGMLRFVPNAEMYLTMYVRKEALLSAQIEGTQCTFDDVLDPDNIELAKKDVAEVVSYVKATEFAIERMKELPLCIRLLRGVHGVLLEGARGSEKSPGEVRTSQNWIGPAGCTLRDALYVPPNVEDMRIALSELEVFANERDDIDAIVKAALIHYQFETVHPFLDGNGRLGRMLITLSLVNDGVLSGPIFYPSYQLKINRSEYCQRLMAVRERGEYREWLKFFCRCMLESAEDAGSSLGRLVRLRSRSAAAINEGLGRSAAKGQKLLSLLEAHPIIDVGFVAGKLDVSRTTANSLVNEFVEMGILKQREDGRKRYRTFLYEDYLTILRHGSDPLGR